ncbi:MAG: iron ABC transporter permease [Gordonia sp. (in: high G+C Gram-positive bacteria)]
MASRSAAVAGAAEVARGSGGIDSGRYRMQVVAIAVGVVLLLLCGLVTLEIGAGGIDFVTSVEAIWSKLTGGHAADPEQARKYLVVWNLRLPRVLMALLAGTTLAIAGTLFQGILRNPLVSPYTLGTAPAAAFGASVAVMFFGGSGEVLIIGSVLAAVVSTAFVLALSATRRLEVTTLILVGIAITQLFTAATSGLQYFADDETLAAIVRWTWGSVNATVWYQVGILAALLVVIYPLVQRRSGAINAIAFAGDDSAKSLGVNVSRVRFEAIGAGVILTAVTIGFTGIIGFVGLVGPHIARLVVGANHRFLIPFSAIIGSAVLLVADAVSRVVVKPAVLPIGIIDALIGVPIFLYLVLSRPKVS